MAWFLNNSSVHLVLLIVLCTLFHVSCSLHHCQSQLELHWAGLWQLISSSIVTIHSHENRTLCPILYDSLVLIDQVFTTCLHGTPSATYQGNSCTILRLLFPNYLYPTVINGYLYNPTITKLPNDIINYKRNISASKDKNFFVLPWSSVILKNSDDLGELLEFKSAKTYKDQTASLWILLRLHFFRDNVFLYLVWFLVLMISVLGGTVCCLFLFWVWNNEICSRFQSSTT